jgi:4-hydroxythreonine-4-phosphate dehydrogenase
MFVSFCTKISKIEKKFLLLLDKNILFMIRLGITTGDINSIALEIILKTFQQGNFNDRYTPVLYAYPKILAYHKKMLNIEEFRFRQINSVEEARPKQLNLVNLDPNIFRVDIGKPTKESMECSLRSLDVAMQDLKDNKIDVLVTAPLSKESHLIAKDHSFKGHTEYLAQYFDAPQHLMMMISENIRIATFTGHLPLQEVSEQVQMEKLMATIALLNQTLKQDFAINQPKIAVLGLNPHAGDAGMLGMQEKEIINPAVEACFQKGMKVFGAFPADGFFGSGNFKNFDAVLSMYHDQGLVPFKLLTAPEGVNFTAGLPIVRTSPAHGTAFDIAGKNIAEPFAFAEAIEMACKIYENRTQYLHAKQNVLQAKTSRERERNA